jgi:hypothetical protein
MNTTNQVSASAALRLRVGATALAAVLAVTTICPVAAAEADGLRETGLLIGLEYVSAYWNKGQCQIVAEAQRGTLVNAAPIVIGGVLAGLTSWALGGNVRHDVATGALAGGIVRIAQQAQLRKIEQALPARLTYPDAVHKALCEAYVRAEKTRLPIVEALVARLGARCDVTPQDTIDGGQMAVRKLQACAAADVGVRDEASAYAQALFEINHSACLSSRVEVANLVEQAALRELRAGGSTAPFILPACLDARSLVDAWSPISITDR